MLFGLAPRHLRTGLGWSNDVLKLSTHGTTHVDAPWHYAPTCEGAKARTIDELPLEYFHGRGVVLDVRQLDPAAAASTEDLQAALARVREQLGIGMTGNPALTYTTNVMFRCADFARLHDKGLGYRFIFIGPEGVWLTIVAVNGSDRFRMSIVGTPQKINHGEDDIRTALRRAMGRDFDYEILSVMRWVRRELVADRYTTQRIFIAGDAAHLMSPTGGFGMNTGIGDATDLGRQKEQATELVAQRRAARIRTCSGRRTWSCG